MTSGPGGVPMTMFYWHNGQLAVACEPYNPNKRREYTLATCPIPDDRSPTGWREHSILGWYAEYSPGFRGRKVLAVVLRTSQHHEFYRWFHTPTDAQKWVEEQGGDRR